MTQPNRHQEPRPSWWQRGIIYQIYPWSFQDSNGDGIGDLQGILQRLDYLNDGTPDSLGVSAIWLSPVYPSPMADFGYDVADYCNIDPRFGDLATFTRLVEAAHQRGIRVIMDFVPNHSSSQHPWFLESRSSRDNPKRDWYIWRDGAKNGGLPNNWLSPFGGSAWTLDPATGQYYFHTFLPEQPELNWRNAAVRDALHEILRFWFTRGVDGFRIDTVSFLIKDAKFRNDPPNPKHIAGAQHPYNSLLHVRSNFQKESYAIARGFRAIANEYPERVLIGEVSSRHLAYLAKFYGAHNDVLHLPFNFALLRLPMQASPLRRHIEAYEASLPRGAWPNYVLGNHDNPRLASRIGDAKTRLAAMLLLTLRGTPFLYYGEELGMHDITIPHERAQDPQALRTPGIGWNRDQCRTPMQWDTSPNAGFSRGAPWLPIAKNYATVNVETERTDPRSMLSLYRKLCWLRNESPALFSGNYRALERIPEGCLAYVREVPGQRFLVALNFSDRERVMALNELGNSALMLLSTRLDRTDDVLYKRFTLRPHEGCVMRLT